MTNDQKIYVIAGGAGIVALAAYVGLMLVPVWKCYSRAWERVAATFLSLYVLVACLALGFAAAYPVVRLWDWLSG